MIPSNVIWILQVHEWGKSMCIPQLNITLNHNLTNEGIVKKKFENFFESSVLRNSTGNTLFRKAGWIGCNRFLRALRMLIQRVHNSKTFFTIPRDNLHFVYHQYCLITFLGFLFGLHVRINGWQPNMLLTPKTLFDNNLCLSYMCIERLFASSWYLIGWFKKLNQRSKTYFSEWLF